MTQEQHKSRQATEELRHNELTIQCAYDGKGKLRKKVENFGYNTTEYAYDYDNAGHLVRVEQNGEVTEEYHFNAKGQRMAQRRESRNGMPLDTELLRYDQRGRLETAGQTTFDYDERDALSGHYAQHGVTAFSYGQDTMLDMAVLPGGTKIRYEYDGFHPTRRYRYLTLTGEYVWDGLKLTVYHDHDLQLEYSFEYGPSGVLHKVLLNALSAKYRQTFSIDTNWPAESADWLHSLRAQSQRKRLWAYLETWYQLAPGIPSKTPLSLYVSCDQVGTPRMLTDRFGRVVKRLRQDSFGVLLEDSYPDLFLPVGFAGGLVDEDTGLVRFGWRDYDPKVGRFTAPDPANDRRGDGDVYDYCVDDPVSRIDPSGLWTQDTFNESRVSRDEQGQFSSSGRASNSTSAAPNKEYSLGEYRGAQLGIFNDHPVIFDDKSSTPASGIQMLAGALTPDKGAVGTFSTGAHLQGTIRLIIYGDSQTGKPSSWTLFEWKPTGKNDPVHGWPLFDWVKVPSASEAFTKRGLQDLLKKFNDK